MSKNQHLIRRGTAAVFLLVLAYAAGAVEPAVDMEAGRKLFNSGSTPACAVCHTLKDADSAGAIGPVLDEIKPDAARVAKALRNGIGQMPSFSSSLSDEQIALLSKYVEAATR